MNDIVISDTTALIILAKSDAFSLLSSLFQKIYIPKAVYDELMVKDDIVNYRIKEFAKIEAISLALELNLMLIIDERKGRKIALNQGLKIVGVLG